MNWFTDAWQELTTGDRIAFGAVIVGGVAAVAAFCQMRDARKAIAEQQQISKQSAELAERSAKASEESAWIAQKGMRISQRAWITVAKITSDQTLPSGVPYEIDVIFYNGGNSPATECKAVLYFRQGPTFAPFYKPTSDQKLYPLGIIGPGSNKHIKIPLENPTENSVVAQDNELFVYGHLEFTDVFGQGHSVQWGFLFDRAECEFKAAPIHNVLRDHAEPEYDN